MQVQQYSDKLPQSLETNTILNTAGTSQPVYSFPSPHGTYTVEHPCRSAEHIGNLTAALKSTSTTQLLHFTMEAQQDIPFLHHNTSNCTMEYQKPKVNLRAKFSNTD